MKIIKLKPLYKVLNKSIEYKLQYIQTNITNAINHKRRAGKRMDPEEVYKHVFNPFEALPQGELNELKYELTEKNGKEAYFGDLADLVYNALRLDSGLLVPVYGIGQELGFTRRNIVDGCVIKYTHRYEDGKVPAHEQIILGGYFAAVSQPTDIQRNNALRRIEDLFKAAPFFHPLNRLIPRDLCSSHK